MNMKTTKFLAVLAVMAMAFTAVAVFSDAEDVSAVAIPTEDPIDVNDGIIVKDPKQITSTINPTATAFYISEDATVKIKDRAAGDLRFYVQNGQQLQLDFTSANLGQNITVYSVTGDQSQKLPVTGTMVTFASTAGEKLSAYYTAATFTISTTVNQAYTSFTQTISKVTNFAEFSADKVFTAAPTAGVYVDIANGQNVISNAVIADFTGFGVLVYDETATDGKYKYYGKGDNIGNLTLDDDTIVTVYNASANLKYTDTDGISGGMKLASVKGYADSETVTNNDPVVVSVDNEVLQVGGTQVAGDITFSGTTKAAARFTIAAGATATIASKAIMTGTVVTEGTLTLKSKELTAELVITSTNGGKVVAQAKELWKAEGGAAVGLIVDLTGFNGFVDTSAISTVAKVQDYFATAAVPMNQTYDVITNTTLYGTMDVRGILIIEPGVTLTIMQDATTKSHPELTMESQFSQIINYGKIVVKTALNEQTETTVATIGVIPAISVTGGQFVNEGTIEASSKTGQYSYALVVGGTMAANASTYDEETQKYTYEYEGLDSLTENKFSFVNNGTISISSNDAVFLNGVVNNGTIRMLGTMFGFTDFDADNPEYSVLDYSKFEINGKVYDTVSVDLMESGAEFNVLSAQFDYGSESVIYVANTGITDRNSTAGSSTLAIGQVGDTDSGTYTVKNLKMIGSNDTNYSKTPAITVSGLTITSNPRAEAAYVSVVTEGAILVDGELSVPAYAVLNMEALKVNGSMNIAKDSACTINTLTVNGKVIDSSAAATIATINAAYFDKNGTTTYTTFAEAVSEAQKAEVFLVTVGGTSMVIDSDFTVPAEMTISGQKITIGKSTAKAEVVVPVSALLSIDNIVVANGQLTAPDSTSITGTVKADVNQSGESDAKYMSLGFALSKASAGDVIYLDQDYKASSTTLTIPSGVTVDATASDNKPAFAAVASDLIIGGTLIVDDFLFIAETDDSIGITVDGYLKDADETGGHVADKWFTPVGVSYVETLTVGDDEVTYFVITNLSNLQQAVIDSDDGEVTVEGDAKLGDVTITGTDDKQAIVYFKEDISAGTITLDNAKIVTYRGNKVTATFADALGSIVIRGAYVNSKEMSINSEDDGVIMSGGIIDTVDESYYIAFYGITGMDAAQILWGNYDAFDTAAVYPVITFAGDTLVQNKNNQILNPLEPVADPTQHPEEGETNITYDVISITGALTVDNSSKLDVEADIDVLGSLAAKERTDSATAGMISVDKGDAFVGTSKALVWDKKAAWNAYNNPDENIDGDYGDVLGVLAAAATMDGNIEFANDSFITVASDATVDDAIVGDLKSLPIMVDGVLWITVYGNTNFSMDGLKAPIWDCEVDKILDKEGNEIAKFSDKYRVIYDSPATALDTYEGVFITVDYNVFTVMIKTDGSIKAVYIDDVLTQVSQNANTFVLSKLETGRHVVKVEPISGYSADKCYLYLNDGTKLTGMTFIFDEDDCQETESGVKYVEYNVAGTEIIPEPEPVEPEKESEWTITTILLVILVILIAIMAVIVALRLNRS